MMKFKYYVWLHRGYIDENTLTEIKEISFLIEAKNREIADRMVESMLNVQGNIKVFIGCEYCRDMIIIKEGINL